MKLGEYLNAINYTKDDLFADEGAEKGYVPFVINRCLSYFPDTIMQVNELNTNPNVSKKMQFDYLKNAIRKRKRFSKWLKNTKDDRLESIKLHFGYGDKKALEAMRVLSDEKIDEIHENISKMTSS
jgi:hypothetical protein|tara:strand:+ start:37 stop:414 length:378 start_codon:yes stop_codon:yes gene_type:complete